MKTYSKLINTLNASQSKPASGANTDTTILSEPVNNSANVYANKNNGGSFTPSLDQFDDMNDFPNGGGMNYYNADPNIDALSLLEYRLQNMQIDYTKRLDYWKKKKIDLLTEHDLKDEPNPAYALTIKMIFKKVFDELRPLFVFSDAQIYHVYQDAKPRLRKLGDELNAACVQLNTQTTNAGANELDKARAGIKICNASITMLNGIISLINDVSREIKLCVKFEEIAEKTVVCLLDFAASVLVKFPIPAFNFNFGLGSLYRNYLFHSIHPETNRVEAFIAGTEGEIERANKALKDVFPKNPEPIQNEGSLPPFQDNMRFNSHFFGTRNGPSGREDNFSMLGNLSAACA